MEDFDFASDAFFGSWKTRSGGSSKGKSSSASADGKEAMSFDAEDVVISIELNIE